MPTLTERLTEVMLAMGWEHADLVRVSGESQSVVSQWLGKGSKDIKSIGKTEAAERIEQESGFASLWIAKGKGPKMAANAGQPISLERALPVVLHALAAIPPARWVSVCAQLEQVVGRPEMLDDVLSELAVLLTQPGKRLGAGT